MAKTEISQKKLKDELNARLQLKTPEFHLETCGGKLSGSLVSDTFLGLDDHERQLRIWNALNDAFGSQSVKFVGTLLAYTRAEWNVTL